MSEIKSEESISTLKGAGSRLKEANSDLKSYWTGSAAEKFNINQQELEKELEAIEAQLTLLESVEIVKNELEEQKKELKELEKEYQKVQTEMSYCTDPMDQKYIQLAGQLRVLERQIRDIKIKIARIKVDLEIYLNGIIDQKISLERARTITSGNKAKASKTNSTTKSRPKTSTNDSSKSNSTTTSGSNKDNSKTKDDSKKENSIPRKESNSNTYTSSELESLVGEKVADTSSYNNSAAKNWCVWYVRGRAVERTGKDTGSIGHGKDMYNNLKAKGSAAAVEGTRENIKANIIVSYGKGHGSEGAKYGHVIYIEGIVGDTVYYTEGGTGNGTFATNGVMKTISVDELLNGGKAGYDLQGFIDVDKL